MTKFELVSGYEDTSLLPKRATSGSAGYDFVVAEDIIIPSYESLMNKAY
jgi:dUTPase